MEDMVEEMYALKQYLYEQTLQIEKQLSRTDRKLSFVVTNNVKGNKTKEIVVNCATVPSTETFKWSKAD